MAMKMPTTKSAVSLLNRFLVVGIFIFITAARGFCSLPPARTRYTNYTIEYPSQRPGLASAIIDMLRTSPPFPGLPANAPTFGKTILIILPANDEQFDSITGDRIPEWSAGVADPVAGVIVMPGYSGGRASANMRGVLRHELAHIALHRYLGRALLPRWFNEGYATWAAGELDVDGGWRLRVAFATKRAPPLDSLELAWPTATVDAELAYLLSASVVEYLIRESGERGLTLFLERWRDTQNMERALAATYGISLDQLETHWRKDVKRRYGWFAVVTQSALFMTGASFILLILFGIRRRRDRAKLAMLKATEPPDEPAFWDEDVIPDENVDGGPGQREY